VALLEKRITQNANKSGSKKVESRQHEKVSIKIDINSSANEIERFAIFVLKKLINDSLPPTPDNYRIYFEKLLDEKSIDFQKKIQELLEFEESNYSENRVEIEKDVKEIFISINSVIKVVNSIYKNIRLIKQLSIETHNELKENDNPLVIKNSASSFNTKLSQFLSSIDKQIELLQEKYKKAGEIFKNIENSTIFDTRFGVYNKRYFIEQAKKEREKIIKFKHESCIVTLQVKESVLLKLPYQKDKIFLLRVIAKMLLKTSRRNDIISYFGENSFIMLLRHTDLESTKKASIRMHELLTNANIILNDMEVDIDIGIGIALIKKDIEIEESINCALEAMSETGKNKDIYKVCKEGGE